MRHRAPRFAHQSGGGLTMAGYVTGCTTPAGSAAVLTTVTGAASTGFAGQRELTPVEPSLDVGGGSACAGRRCGVRQRGPRQVTPAVRPRCVLQARGPARRGPTVGLPLLRRSRRGAPGLGLAVVEQVGDRRASRHPGPASTR